MWTPYFHRGLGDIRDWIPGKALDGLFVMTFTGGLCGLEKAGQWSQSVGAVKGRRILKCRGYGIKMVMGDMAERWNSKRVLRGVVKHFHSADRVPNFSTNSIHHRTTSRG